MSTPQRRKELAAERERSADREARRRREEPTDEEQIEDRLKALLYESTNLDPKTEELARLLLLHVTGSEF